MNVLIIGSGGREHALAWKVAQSPRLHHLLIAPGNAGTAAVGENVPLNVMDFEGLGQLCLDRSIDLVVVGPEAPLVGGIRDYFEQNASLQHIPLVGPGQAGAQLEGSKEFSKRFMQRHGIPTAAYESFSADSLQEGLAYLEQAAAPYVLKADGLAAGKGVLILDNLEEAKAELTNMLEGEKFGAASSKVVIESFLDGIELSVFVLTDGVSYKILPEAKDYKRIGEGDTGLNTGGMGAISPVAFAHDGFLDKVEERIVKPTVKGLQDENIPFKGFLFIGLMNVGGDPYVVEYNVRMGDPETEVVLPRISSDVLDILDGAARGDLANRDFAIDTQTAATVMLVSGGYPEAYEKGKTINGLSGVQGSIPFHAGTAVKDGQTVTSGGRVLALTSLANSMDDALAQSYENAKTVHFDGVYYRRDIGFDLK